MSPLILGSQSPRRKEILEYFGCPFTQVASDFDEDSVPFDGDPKNYVQVLASKKSDVLSQKFPDALILTADTTVYANGKLYNKPKDLAEAKQMLQELCGTWQTVYTGLALRKGEKFVSGVEATRVLLNPWNQDQIDRYLANHPWQDKAGGYAIQGASGVVVNQIEGCYYNVMGLPINTLARLFQEFGIALI